MPIKRRVGIILIWTFMSLYLSCRLLAAQGIESVNEVCTFYDEEIDDEYKDYERYDISEGDIMIKESGRYYIKGTTTTSCITVLSGVTDVEIVLDNVNIILPGHIKNGALNDNSKGPVEIVLLGENNLQGGGYCAAISIQPTANLVISERSTGKLVARGGYYSAGIGTSCCTSGGNISINGGEIYAYGDIGSCGIGNGAGGSKEVTTVESVIINGGSIYCEGGNKASALGGGRYSYTKHIYINGGQVIAKGGAEASAIGRGVQQATAKSIIDLLGGTIIAYQGERKANSPNTVAAIDLINGGCIGPETVVIAMNAIKMKDEVEGTYELNIKEVEQPFNLTVEALNIFLQDITLIDDGEDLYFHIPKGKYQLCFESGGQLYKWEIGQAEESDVVEPPEQGSNTENETDNIPEEDAPEGNIPKEDELEEDMTKGNELEGNMTKGDELEGDIPKEDEVEGNIPKNDASDEEVLEDDQSIGNGPVQANNNITVYRSAVPQHISWEAINLFRDKELFYIHYGISLQRNIE